MAPSRGMGTLTVWREKGCVSLCAIGDISVLTGQLDEPVRVRNTSRQSRASDGDDRPPLRGDHSFGIVGKVAGKISLG